MLNIAALDFWKHTKEYSITFQSLKRRWEAREKESKGFSKCTLLLLFFFILRLHENYISKWTKSFSIKELYHKAIRKISLNLKCLLSWCTLHHNKQTAWSLWTVSDNYCLYCGCEPQESFRKDFYHVCPLHVQTIARATFAFIWVITSLG